MVSKYELLYTKLRKECKPEIFKFVDTSEIKGLEGLLGQERAVNAMKFGIKIKTKGYNIYMSGSTGTGKSNYAKNYISSIAKDQKVPDDWCYVYNFDKPNQPMAISMPAGMGKIFKKDMEEFIKIIKWEIKKAFDSEDYEKEKSELIKVYQSKKDELVEKLNEDAKEYGFIVKTTNAGIYFLPVVDGKTISEDEFGELDDEIKQEISKKSNIVQLGTIGIIRKIKNLEKEAEVKISEWENKIALFAVGMQINDLKEKYHDFEKISNYLDDVQHNILANLNDFRDEEVQEDQNQNILPWINKNVETPTDKYRVNLVLDNSNANGAPVIIDYNPTFYNLMGKFEYENEFGTMVTDHTMIKAGLIHYANGGYLILQAKDVLGNPNSWDSLKRVLKTGQITISNFKDQLGFVPVSTIKPEPIPVELKVILIGNESTYQLLLNFDDDFKKLFKIKVDFDDDMPRSRKNMINLSRFISSYCNNEKIMHFAPEGVAKIVEYSSKLVQDQEKLTTRFNDIVEILSEASAWAQIDNSKIVTAKHVVKAENEKLKRIKKYDEKFLEFMIKDKIFIDTEGMVVGQINALSVLDVGDFSFGKPSRITATTFIGNKGVVNVEREINLSGAMHTKGVLILSGFLGQKYAQDMVLSLTANICFEQMYSGVDGDSASSAELYAILSSLSEVPISQNIAVTGSVNQKGEIQPVGGVTEKIEGFYALCKLRGLNGSQGVVIPKQNIINLTLSDDIIESVKNNEFHIYAIENIDEGIEILTGKKAGKRNKDGTYTKNSINYLVYSKLRKYSKAVQAKIR